MIIFGLVLGLIGCIALALLSAGLIILGVVCVRETLKGASKEQLERELQRRLDKSQDE